MTLQVTEWDGTPIDTPGLYSGVSMDAYHGPSLCNGYSISSSGLRKIFAFSPMDYWIESPFNPERIEPKDKEAFILGRAAHHLLLGESEFNKHFAIRPEQLEGKDWHGNRKECRAWLKQKADEGITVITGTQVVHIRGMAGILPWQGEQTPDSGLRQNPIASDLLSGLIEHSMVFRDPVTGLWMKVRPDAVPTSDLDFADLKTTTSIRMDDIQRTIGEYRYDMQACMVGRACRMVLGREMSSFSLVFVEKTPPYGVAVVGLKPEDLAQAEQDVDMALRVFARCMETSRWPGPGGSQATGMFAEVPSWVRARADNRRKFLEDELRVT
jgi:hypothetical protein